MSVSAVAVTEFTVEEKYLKWLHVKSTEQNAKITISV